MCRTSLSGCPKRALASWPTQFPSWQNCPRSVLPPVRPTASDAPHDFFNLLRPSQPGLCFDLLLGHSFLFGGTLIGVSFSPLQEAWPSFPQCSSWSQGCSGKRRSSRQITPCPCPFRRPCRASRRSSPRHWRKSRAYKLSGPALWGAALLLCSSTLSQVSSLAEKTS